MSDISPTNRVGAVAPMWPQIRTLHLRVRSAVIDRMPDEQRSSLLLRQTNSPNPCSFLKSCARQAGRCFRTPVTAAAARSLLRSRRRRRIAPCLASYHHPAGRGLLEFLAPTTKRWGSILQVQRQSMIPPHQRSVAAAGRRHIERKERKKEIPYKEGKLKDIGSH